MIRAKFNPEAITGLSVEDALELGLKLGAVLEARSLEAGIRNIQVKIEIAEILLECLALNRVEYVVNSIDANGRNMILKTFPGFSVRQNGR